MLISALGVSDKSILLSSYVVTGGRYVVCVSLVDSGCTGEAFVDFAFAVKNRIPMTKLLRKRPLYLADGGFSSWVEYTATIELAVGDHRETLICFVTTLARENPVILGLPWLRKHNPRVDWETLQLEFTSKCQGSCLPQHIESQVAQQASLETAAELEAPQETKNWKRFHATVEDADEDDEDMFDDDEGHDIATSKLTAVARTKRTTQRRQARRWQRVLVRRNTPGEPRWTLAPPGARAVPIEAWAPRTPKQIEARAGTRRPQPRQRGRRPTPAPPPRGKISWEDASLLGAPNFLALCQMKGTTVMQTTMAELDRAVEQEPDIHLPSLPEQFFKGVLDGTVSTREAKERLPGDFHDFIDALAGEGEALSRITEEDAKKFFDKANQGNPTVEEIQAKLPAEYRDLVAAFMPQDADILPPHRSYDHKIELIPGGKVPYSKNRPLSPTELRVLKRWLDDNLVKGFIRPSRSSAASPILIAQKPGGGVRICVDFRGINNATLKSRYPIPLIRETLDSICKAKFFTKLDVIAAFNRVRVAPGSEWLTAFITRFGLYESLVTPFGLQGAPATFQNYVNDILYDALDDYATAYLDDILIYSGTLEEHIKQVREVLKRLIDAGLQIDIGKCEFHTKKTKYLGLIITPGGIEMDPAKVEAVRDWEAPTNRRQLQRFLGFANFYRRFIRSFSSHTKPLHELTKKLAEWNWDESCAAAFQRLKRCFVTAPALRIYDWEKPAVVEVDASDWSTGGALLQEGDDGELQPVAYFSAKHSAAECNYDIYDKELLAIIKALEEWRPELEGAAKKFDIITDHKNLQTFSTTKQLSPRHMRWSEFLSRFNFQIIYRPGAANARPDALSRKPEHMPRDVKDDRLRNRRRPLIAPDKFDPETFGEEIQLFAIDTSRHTEDLITDSYASSAFMASVMKALKSAGVRAWPSAIKQRLRVAFAECKLTAGRVYYRDRLMIDPDDVDLHLQLIHRTHSSAPGGHPGRVKTLDLMNRVYWWPGMSVAVRAFCKGCRLCTRTKTPRSKPVGFLKPLPLPMAPWRDISVDYITPLPPCQRLGLEFKHVAVVVDRLTKMRHFIATTSLEADELADRFIERVYSLHGTPETIVSDRGTQFVSTFWRALSARLGVVLKPSSAFHPQTNGQTERINAELEQYLRLFVGWAQDDWANWLPLAEFAGNNMVSETTGVSPFFANYGLHPRVGVEPMRPCPPNVSEQQKREFFRASELADRFKAILEGATALARQAQDRHEEIANRKREDAPRYHVGDTVMLDMQNYKTGRPTAKLAPRWEGPFRVEKASSHAVTLKLPANMAIFPTFHVSKVKRCEGVELAGQGEIEDNVRANHGRIVTRNDDEKDVVEWKFEKILGYGKADNGRWQYQVKWTGHEEATWQPATDLRGCDDDIWDFHDAHPELPGPPAWVARRKAKEGPQARERPQARGKAAGRQMYK